MARIDKSVFISYRRTNFPWALFIYQGLLHADYDVFFDYTGIGPGDFETSILENIRSRAHFVVVLTPSALERCGEPGDWLRREIELALRTQRNIIPFTFEDFHFSDPKVRAQLTGDLVKLSAYQAIPFYAAYPFAALDKLKEFLNVDVTTVPHPATLAAQQAAAEQATAAQAAPPVQEKELTAQEYFERAVALNDPAEEIRLYTEAIRLKPDFYEVFHMRGIAQLELGNLDAAIADFSHAIQIKPDLHEVFFFRGTAKKELGNLDAAITDFRKYLELGGGENYGNTEIVERIIRDLEKSLAALAGESKASASSDSENPPSPSPANSNP